MTLTFELYAKQNERWPPDGRHIMAQYDADSIVVYQAYNAEIGHHAARSGTFGNGWSLNRMSWIKPNFLWMMYRSGWGTKPGQEVTLAIRLRRAAFDAMLAAAVPSSFDAAQHADREAWSAAVASSSVRVQWDPDHDPAGARLARRALQLGLRGATLASFAREWIVEIEDLSPFVAQQRPLAAHSPYRELLTPRETVYPVADPAVAASLGVAT